ncbi:MAG: sigma-70 family RNA polymerase sigma factor [Planctomycetaceae bacterium]
MPLKAAQLVTLIEGHAAVLRLWIRARCPSPDDVVQEAFCRLATLDRPPDNPVAWLYQVCRNLAANDRLSDARRRRRERDRSVPEVAECLPSEDVERAEAIAAVEQLEEPLREVLVARIWGQMTLEEVAAMCGISTATAFRRYQAALEELRTQLEAGVRRRP